MAMFAAASWYLYREYTRQAVPAPAPVVVKPAPVKAPPFLGNDELAKIRKNARGGAPNVRWASIELLYALGDPESVPLLERAVTEEADPANKLKALKMLTEAGGKASVSGIVKGLKDPDKDVRIATIQALEKLGDPAAARWIAQAADKEYEPEVKVEAFRALGSFQDKRRADFEALALRLRQQYEKAVERAKKLQEEELDENPDLREAPQLPEAPK